MAAQSQIGTSPVLLYVEDDVAAASLFKLVLKDLQLSALLFVVGSSREALAFLYQAPPY